MVAEFPDFTPISTSTMQDVAELVRGFEHYADFNPVAIWCWNRGHPGGVCRLYGNPVVKWKDPVAGRPFLSFAAHGVFHRTATTLLDFARSADLAPCLRAIPVTHDTMLARSSDTLVVTGDRDNFDYLLSVDDWTQLHGSRFRNIRNAINRLERHQHISVRILPLDDAATHARVERLCHRWAQQRGVTHHQFLPELTAIRNLFDCQHTSGLFILGAFIDDTLAGFSVNECLPSGRGIGHFAKADYTWQGVSTYLLHQVCVHLQRHEVQVLNIEADLGDPGLRRAKGLLNPTGFLEKAMVLAQ